MCHSGPAVSRALRSPTRRDHLKPRESGTCEGDNGYGEAATALAIFLLHRNRVSRAWRMSFPTVSSSRRRNRLGCAACNCSGRQLRSWRAVTWRITFMTTRLSRSRPRAEARGARRAQIKITDLNNVLFQRPLTVERRGCGCAWFDTGTHESFLYAAEFVRMIEVRQGLKIA
jgi:hypothetical protein